MRLVISTLFIDRYNNQNRESISYVYEDIDSSDMSALQIIGQVKPLIEHSNELTQEEIVDWNLHEDDEKLWDDWEAPSVMTKEGDNWIWEREDRVGENYIRIKLNQNYGYEINVQQSEFKIYGYKLGVGGNNDISIKQCDNGCSNDSLFE